MPIKNYNFPREGNLKQLYSVKFEPGGNQKGEVFIIAENTEEASQIFHSFYATEERNPQNIPEGGKISNIRKLEKMIINKVTDIVLVNEDK